VPPLPPASPPPPHGPPHGVVTWTPVRYVTFAPAGSDETYSRFSFTVRNDGAVPLSAHLVASNSTASVTITPPELDALAPNATLAVEVFFPSRLLEDDIQVRISIPSAPVLIPLDPARFPKGSAGVSDDNSGQAALVILGLIVSGGVAYWCRRRYRQSLEEGAGGGAFAAAPGGSGGGGNNPYERMEEESGGGPVDAHAAQPPAAATAPAAAQHGGVQMGVLQAVAALPGRLRRPRRPRRSSSGPASPAAVGLVLGAGTVVATHEEAVASRASRGGGNGGGGGGSSGAPGERPASPQEREWQGAWQEDDGWDLSDDALLGTDEEKDDDAPPPPRPAVQPAAAKAAPAKRVEEPVAAPGGSDSDWDS
jgi:hypothetical protein